MIVVGLSGGIASGKSAVGRMLCDRGAMLIDADLVARELMSPGRPAFRAVVEHFGSQIMDESGSIDRARLGEIVFSDENALQVLDGLVHPLVVEEICELVSEATAELVVIEAIKLFESGLNGICDAVWVVTCARETQLARLVDARGLSDAEAILRVNAQGDLWQLAERADIVIANDGSMEALESKVDAQFRGLWINKPRPFHVIRQAPWVWLGLCSMAVAMVLVLAPDTMSIGQRLLAACLMALTAAVALDIVAVEQGRR